MNATDVFMLVVRWLHLVSAAAWVGGSIFYLLVLRPAMRRSPDSAGFVGQAAATEFRALVDTCIVVLVVTGALLMFHRITPGEIGVAYVSVLAIKIALSAAMFAIALRRRRALRARPSEEQSHPAGRLSRVARALSGYNLIVILGVLVFLLSDVLKMLYELAIAG